MSRTGTPCYQPRGFYRVSVLIIPEDAIIGMREHGARWVTWRGRSVKRIKAAAHRAYAGASLAFGAPTYHLR